MSRLCTLAGLSVMLAAAVVAGGCARYPTMAAGQTPALLFTTMAVQGQINPAYYYFVALQASTDASVQNARPEQGPFAVIQANSGINGWGNGWGTGRITDYVMYHGGQATQFSVNCADLASCPAAVASGGVPVGPPFSYAVSSDGHSLTIAVKLSTLGHNGAVTPDTTGGSTISVPGGVVINTITTDHLETNPNASPKPVDSLEQGSLPLIDLHQSKVVDLTPAGDVLFPNSSVTTADLRLSQVEIDVRLP